MPKLYGDSLVDLPNDGEKTSSPAALAVQVLHMGALTDINNIL
jgi:hypothetical protein